VATAEPTISQTLAGYTQALNLAQVPAAQSLRARHLMLDAIGCALAARGEDFAATFVRGAQALAGMDGERGELGERGVIGHAQRLPLRDAALLNGALAHGLDYDDTHMAGIVHLSVSLLPTVLALGAQRGSSGAQVLAAYIAGLECGARLASVARGGFHAQGFHPTALVGTFASALAAGRLLGLSAVQLTQAQGVALSMAGGSLQFLEDGAWTKRLHAGWAAQCGITAAHLAAQDLPAPTAAYEGRYGLFNMFMGAESRVAADVPAATAGLNANGQCTRWELEQIAVKPYAACHFSHACIDAAVALHAGGLQPEHIRSVQALLPAGAMPVVAEPQASKRRPRSDYEAKFSVHYGIASGLLRGGLALQDLRPAAFTDPAALALMDRITCEVDPHSSFPRHYTGELRVTLADGSVRVHREAVNRGHAERPLTNAEVRSKFFDNATLHFTHEHAQAICEAVLALDDMADVRTLETLLAQDPQPLR